MTKISNTPKKEFDYEEISLTFLLNVLWRNKKLIILTLLSFLIFSSAFTILIKKKIWQGRFEIVLRTNGTTKNLNSLRNFGFGVGDSTISIQPEESRRIIQKKVKEILSKDLSSCLWSHPKSFSVKVRYNKQQNAYRASFYPGAKLVDSKTVFFESTDYDDVMKYILFTV